MDMGRTPRGLIGRIFHWTHRRVFIGRFVCRYAQGKYDTNDRPEDTTCNPSSPECPNSQANLLETPPVFRRSWIDAGYTNENAFPRVKNGVKMGEGDGTVSLLSLGAMCVEGWKK